MVESHGPALWARSQSVLLYTTLPDKAILGLPRALGTKILSDLGVTAFTDVQLLNLTVIIWWTEEYCPKFI